jgi:hypothetical protein
MLRFTRTSTLTDERSRHLHPTRFVILGLGGRNKVEFGRVGDMVCCAHDGLFRRAGSSEVLNRANCHFPRIFYRGMGNV